MLGYALATFGSESGLAEWGWRVAFIVAALLGLITLWIRLSVNETEIFKARVAAEGAPKNPLKDVILNHRGDAMRVGVTPRNDMFRRRLQFSHGPRSLRKSEGIEHGKVLARADCTGHGASGGIGAAIIKRLAQEGARPITHYSQDERAAQALIQF